MKAAQLTEFGQPLTMADIKTPEIGSNDVLVKVKACGVCYSDVKSWKGQRKIPLPFTLGHEISGIVSEVGKNVKNVVAGDPVAVYFYVTDETCSRCRSGQENLCNNITLNFGGYAEYVSVPDKNCMRMPKNASFEDAAFLTDAGLTSYNAIMDKANVRLGETALLQGMGGLASAGLQILKLLGARVIAVSRTPAKLDFAKSLGADLIINSTKEDVVAEVMKFTANEGVEYAFDYTGQAETLATDLKCLRGGGKLFPLGMAPPTLDLPPTMVGRSLQIVFSRGGTRKDLVDLLKLLGDGKIKSIVTQTFDLAGASKALDLLSKGQIVGRAVVKP